MSSAIFSFPVRWRQDVSYCVNVAIVHLSKLTTVSFKDKCNGMFTSWVSLNDFGTLYRRFFNGTYRVYSDWSDGSIVTLYEGSDESKAEEAWNAAIA